jgi:hypothetical protein
MQNIGPVLLHRLGYPFEIREKGQQDDGCLAPDRGDDPINVTINKIVAYLETEMINAHFY